ncbi:MAG: glycosyltransferase family 2 protein [Bacteroidales bacterium]|nr:glycosyltransferase family 2 protein [Bacteroidales bacterium]
MDKYRTAVVLLNWNGRHLLERFLPGIIAHLPIGCELIVADNGSHDDSVSYLKKYHPEIRLIAMPENYGYTGGYNRALKEVDADVYVLLNSDMEVSPGWIEPALRYLKDNPHVAALQPKIRSLNNREYFEYAGAGGGFLDVLGYPFCRGRIFNTLEKDNGQYDDAAEIFWASGAALFIRSEVFWKAGGFDEDFFAHMEEIDLCWRIQNMGYKVVFCPPSVVYHLGGGSLPKSNPRKTYYNFRNSLFMLAKNLPSRGFFLRIVLRLLLDILASMKFLIQGSPGDWLAVYKAHLAFLTRVSALRKQTTGRQQKLPGLICKKSIVKAYFICRKRRFSQLDFKASRASL